MVVFNKPYYLFVSERLITQILEKMVNITQQSDPDYRPLMKSLGDNFAFKSRQDIEKVVEKLRELPELKKK